MKTTFLTLVLTASILLFYGCQTIYVSDIETSYFTKNCPTHSILIMSCDNCNPKTLNKNLCSELNTLFTKKGYTVAEYCPSKFDSTEYFNALNTHKPEFVLCILPQNILEKKAVSNKKLPYKIEALYRRDSGKISSVYLGKISITYNENNKSAILKDASGKIYNAIVDNQILK
jgi:hypothetical protein